MYDVERLKIKDAPKPAPTPVKKPLPYPRSNDAADLAEYWDPLPLAPDWHVKKAAIAALAIFPATFAVAQEDPVRYPSRPVNGLIRCWSTGRTNFRSMSTKGDHR